MGASPKSNTCTMCGWPSCDVTSASRRKRASASVFVASSGAGSLTATRRLRREVNALVDGAHAALPDLTDQLEGVLQDDAGQTLCRLLRGHARGLAERSDLESAAFRSVRHRSF